MDKRIHIRNAKTMRPRILTFLLYVPFQGMTGWYICFLQNKSAGTFQHKRKLLNVSEK